MPDSNPLGPLGERVRELETLARMGARSHESLNLKMDGQTQILGELVANQRQIKDMLGDGKTTMEDHHSRITSLETTRTQNQTKESTLKKVAAAGWTGFLFVAGALGYHALGTPPKIP